MSDMCLFFTALAGCCAYCLLLGVLISIQSYLAAILKHLRDIEEKGAMPTAAAVSPSQSHDIKSF